jgi:pimeloyl-ACP methyl ester carboxylesterase
LAEVVLIHGAWHGAWCWDGVVASLERRGVRGTAVELPLTSFGDDVACARTAIEAAEPPSIVVGHSYGGEVLSQAASGSDARHLVYLAAFMLDEGEDRSHMLIKHGSPLLKHVHPEEGGIVVNLESVHDLFYGDSDSDTVATIAPLLRPMGTSIGPYTPRTPAWKTIPSTFIVCTNDGALPVAAQREMAQRAGTVIDLPTDHSPFLTRPDELATVFIDLM